MELLAWVMRCFILVVTGICFMDNRMRAAGSKGGFSFRCRGHSPAYRSALTLSCCGRGSSSYSVWLSWWLSTWLNRTLHGREIAICAAGSVMS